MQTIAGKVIGITVSKTCTSHSIQISAPHPRDDYKAQIDSSAAHAEAARCNHPNGVTGIRMLHYAVADLARAASFWTAVGEQVVWTNAAEFVLGRLPITYHSASANPLWKKWVEMSRARPVRLDLQTNRKWSRRDTDAFSLALRNQHDEVLNLGISFPSRWDIWCFHRIRHYGLFASGNRAETIARARELLGLTTPAAEAAVEIDAAAAQPLAKPCPCRGGRMFVIETFGPAANHATGPRRLPSQSGSTPHERGHHVTHPHRQAHLRWSQPGHGDARPDSHPSVLSTAQSVPKAILIGAKESKRPVSAHHHLTAKLSRLASTVNTAIKSP